MAGLQQQLARLGAHSLSLQQTQQAIEDRINDRQQPAIADLDLTVSDPPTQAQVQATADKIDSILAALRAAGVISP